MKSVFSVAFLLVIIVASLILDGSFEREAMETDGTSTPIPPVMVGMPPGIYGNSLEKDIKTSINRFNQGNVNGIVHLTVVNNMANSNAYYTNTQANTKAAVARILPQIIKDEKILANNEYWKTNNDMTKNVNSLYSTLKFSNY